MLAGGVPVIKCAWALCSLAEPPSHLDFNRMIRGISNITITAVPLLRQFAFIWDADRSCWRVASPSRTHCSF